MFRRKRNLSIFWHDGQWEVRKGHLVVERFVALQDAVSFCKD